MKEEAVFLLIAFLGTPTLASVVGLLYAAKGLSPRAAFWRSVLLTPIMGIAFGLGIGQIFDWLYPGGGWLPGPGPLYMAFIGAAGGLIVGPLGGGLIALSKGSKSERDTVKTRCRSCQSLHGEGAKFCAQCGTEFPKVECGEPHASADRPRDERFSGR
jgi:hypothetical protein